MTTIAWDGKILAADRQYTNGEVPLSGCKLRILETPGAYGGIAMACTGSHFASNYLEDWYTNGARESAFPRMQDDKEDWARMIVATVDMKILIFDKSHLPLEIQDPFTAWGSGKETALGALAMGANAIKAVQIASRFNIYTGCGFDAYNVRTKRRFHGK